MDRHLGTVVGESQIQTVLVRAALALFPAKSKGLRQFPIPSLKLFVKVLDLALNVRPRSLNRSWIVQVVKDALCHASQLHQVQEVREELGCTSFTHSKSGPRTTPGIEGERESTLV